MRQSREPTPSQKLRALLTLQRQLSSIGAKLDKIGEQDTSAIVGEAAMGIDARISWLRELIAGRDRVRRVRGAIPMPGSRVRKVASKLATMLGG